MKRKEMERGSVMVEAAIIYPLFIIAVFTIILISLVKLQQSAIEMGTQKIVTQAAREAAYPGYEQYLTGFVTNGKQNNAEIEMDFKEFPNKNMVTNFYKNRKLYRSLVRDYSHIDNTFPTKLHDFLRKYAVLSGLETTESVKIEGFMTPMAKVDVTYKIRLPKFVKFIGVNTDISISASSYAFASDSTEFVRNVDMGVDLIRFMLDKLGFGGKVDAFMEKLIDLKQKFGG